MDGSMGGGGGGYSPSSPVEFKPDTQQLLNSLNNGYGPASSGGGSGGDPHSPTLSAGGGGGNFGSPASGRAVSPSSAASGSDVNPNVNSYPPNHPLSGSKHFCSICGDRASGKHYGVFSCEGCKGFFKRTVRKELSYVCRENKECIIDKRQRNRCQFCRYTKCLQTGMKREAVQDERNRSGGTAGGGYKEASAIKTDSDFVNSDSSGNNACTFIDEVSVERILEAENAADSQQRFRHASSGSNGGGVPPCKKDVLRSLITWARLIPKFKDLKPDVQLTLIKSGWNELLIAKYAFQSMRLAKQALFVTDNLIVTREDADVSGLGDIFDRIHVEVITKMKEMKMDEAELGCLRAIVLFNPDAKNLDQNSSGRVEQLRERVYATLERRCRNNHRDNEPSRFAKLLLRLPALRSIGLKCVEQQFFDELLKEDDGSTPQDAFDFTSGNTAATNGSDVAPPVDDSSIVEALMQNILEG